MLKLYDIKWTSSNHYPESLHYLPGANVLWCIHATNNHSRDIAVYTTRISTGFIAAESAEQAIQIVMSEFPGANISSISKFDGMPFMSPDVTAPAWAIERYNYFANTGKLLPVSALFANDGGYSSVTIASNAPACLHYCVAWGINSPYDSRVLPLTTERTIVLSVLANLGDRRGIKWSLEDVDQDVRVEMVDELTAVVKSLLNK